MSRKPGGKGGKKAKWGDQTLNESEKGELLEFCGKAMEGEREKCLTLDLG